MRICIIGKYPPIEGGVSRETYWIARRLAERGHQVWVVTNSTEVEPDYRIHLQPDDDTWLEPVFPASGGFVAVRRPEPFSTRRMAHIPRTSATVSRLAGAAIDTIRTHGCEAVLAYYLEPYGVAALLAHQRTGVPYAIKHAGSDIDRLMLVPDLAEIYRDVFRGAAAVMTRRELAGRFLQMGVDPEALVLGVGFDMPALFEPDGPRLGETVWRTLDGPAVAHIPASLRRADPPDLSLPTIGIYGKIGEPKGSFDLLAALQQVKRAGHRFNLLCMSNGRQFAPFVQAIEERGLAPETWLLPFLPHWRVPSFIRSCTAVCFLERGFSIKIHGPTVPREVLSCGVCLIVSGEITDKQGEILGLQSDETALVVGDPRDHASLAGALTRVITDPSSAAAIGRAGAATLREHMPAESVGRRLEALCEALSARRPPASRPEVNQEPAPRTGVDDYAGVDERAGVDESARWPIALRALLPRTTRLLHASALRAWQEAGGETRSGHATAVAQALAFADFLSTHVQSGGVAGLTGPSYLPDVLALETAILRAFGDPDDPRVPRAAAGALPQDEARIDWEGLRPDSLRGCVVHRARFDLLELDRRLERDEAMPDELPPTDVRLLIVPRSNFSVGLFTLSSMTDTLLRLCDGQRTVPEIVSALQAEARGSVPERLTASVQHALSRLHEQGILTYC